MMSTCQIRRAEWIATLQQRQGGSQFMTGLFALMPEAANDSELCVQDLYGQRWVCPRTAAEAPCRAGLHWDALAPIRHPGGLSGKPVERRPTPERPSSVRSAPGTIHHATAAVVAPLRRAGLWDRIDARTLTRLSRGR